MISHIKACVLQKCAELTFRMHIRFVDRILRFQSRIIKQLTMNITKASMKCPEKI